MLNKSTGNRFITIVFFFCFAYNLVSILDIALNLCKSVKYRCCIITIITNNKEQLQLLLE